MFHRAPVPSSISLTLGQSSSGANTTIANVFLHPEFEKGGHLNNDIAVLRTTHQIDPTTLQVWNAIGYLSVSVPKERTCSSTQLNSSPFAFRHLKTVAYLGQR